ncbi:MAG: hydroxyacylglutathione hydrolase [Methylophilaceae bacterium]
MTDIHMRTENLHIEPIPAFEDNYIWLLHNNRDAVVIDPGDAAPVLEILKSKSLNLIAILITHHHADHIDGVAQLLTQYAAEVFAPKYEQYHFKHHALQDGDKINIKELDLSFDILWLPGHTLDHIAYLNATDLFCGDVLFGAGCGRLLGGTAEQMLHSLNKLKALDPNTQIYCTHEYTVKNINFALSLDPANGDLIERKLAVAQLRRNNKASIPNTLALELKTNPFLRCHQQPIIKNSHAENTDELSVFTTIRLLRNHY